MEIPAKPGASRVRRRLTAACTLLAASSAVWAQGDVFSTNTGSSGDPCQDAYQSSIARVLQESTASDAQYQKDVANCQNSSSCIQDAQNQRLARERDINKERADISNQRDICHQQQQLQAASSGGDPCQAAYLAAIGPILQQISDSNTLYQKDVIDCQANSSCIQGAQDRRIAREQNIDKRRTDAGNQRDNCHRQQQQSNTSGGSAHNPQNGAPGNHSGPPLKSGVSQNGKPAQALPAGNGTPDGIPHQPLQGKISKTGGGPGGGLPLPDSTRQQLLKAARDMDRMMTNGQNDTLAGTNKFFNCLSKAITSDLRYLAQPGYVPAAQMAQALHQGTWTYITSDPYANNKAMYQAAMDALKTLQNDPACFFGQAAPGAAVAAATHFAGALAEASEVQKAADAAIRTANAAAERRLAYGAGSGSPKGSPLNRFNPQCAPNMCFPAAFAQDLSWETGESFAAIPFEGNVEIQIVKGVPTKVFNLTGQKTVENLLSSFYGHKKLRGPPLSGTRLQNQIAGKQTVATYKEIVAELRAAGPTSRALIFLDDGAGSGHVVNARNVGNKIIFPDASNSNMDFTDVVQKAQQLSIYRTN